MFCSPALRLCIALESRASKLNIGFVLLSFPPVFIVIFFFSVAIRVNIELFFHCVVFLCVCFVLCFFLIIICLDVCFCRLGDPPRSAQLGRWFVPRLFHLSGLAVWALGGRDHRRSLALPRWETLLFPMSDGGFVLASTVGKSLCKVCEHWYWGAVKGGTVLVYLLLASHMWLFWA